MQLCVSRLLLENCGTLGDRSTAALQFLKNHRKSNKGRIFNFDREDLTEFELPSAVAPPRRTR